ncbi:MAG: SPOR domain-containing protein [Bacteroidales bacterium]|nr:SPOR domain-containing protein [Bacteroidales bacterium]MDT8430670.1 SPOR domain-containing protein [Bacteroidales bacterium]
MAYLGKYIRQILSKKEAVVLPGFGSLVLEEGKGVRGDDGSIDPPGAVVKFDATQPNDNGRLAEEYAAGEQMDPEEARQQVLELVDAIRFKLDKGERYQLDMVGEFSRDDDNRIHFVKDPNWVIDSGLFGLSSLDLLELENEDEQEAGEEQDAEPPGTTGASEEEAAGRGPGELAADSESREEETRAAGAAEEATDVTGEGDTTVKDVEAEQAQEAGAGEVRSGKAKDVSLHPPASVKTPQKGKVQRKQVRRWRVIWIVSGLLIAVLVLVLLIPSDNGLEVGKEGIIIRDTEIGNEGTEGAAEGTGQQPAMGTQAQNDLDAAARESLQEDEEIDDGPVQPPVLENRYFIIAGSFRNLGNATDMSDQLKAAGYPAEIILTENRLYRVSVQSFATKQEALNALPALKTGEGLGNAWLLTR